VKTGREAVQELRIDRARRQVSLSGQALELSDLSYRFLVTLAAAAPDSVAVDRLHAEVWGEVQIGPDTIKQRARLLRESLRQAGLAGDPVPSDRHRGYRLDVPVLFASADEQSRPDYRRLGLVLGATVMVFVVALLMLWPRSAPAALTVSYAAGEPTTEVLAESVAAQFAALQGIDVVEAAPSAGRVRLDLTLEGHGETRRIRLRLTDRRDGRLIASELYDFPSTADLDVSDRIAAHFVLRMQDRLAAAYPDQILAGMALSEDARELYLEALSAMAFGHEAGLLVAWEKLDLAIAAEPDFAAAHARLALVLARLSRMGEGDGALADQARRHAETAFRLAPLDAGSERAMGMALWVGGELDQAREHLLRAEQSLAFLARDLAALEREREVASQGADRP